MILSDKKIPFLIVLLLAIGLSLGSAQENPALLIEHVTLIDGTGRPAIRDVSVLTQGDTIVRVARGSIATNLDVQRIDGTGKFLIPGLMDVHVHISRGGRGRGNANPSEPGIRALHGYIYSGITTVFDAGNTPEFIFGLRDRERAGEIVAPRIFATGGVATAPGGHGGRRGSALVDSWPEAIPLLDEHLSYGPDMLKLTYDEHGWGTRPLIPILPLDVMEKVIAYYNDRGVRTTVHISNEMRAREAILAGVDTLAHPVIQSPISESFARMMGAKKIPMVSTLTIGEGYSRLVEHPEFLDQPIYRAVLEASEIEMQKTRMRDQYDARPWTWWMKIMTPVAQENVRMINEAGGIIALGSDQSLGPATHRELELMVDGGISPLDAIRIGTLNTAIFLGMERTMGSIEEGKLADMVLLNADPLADISNAANIEMVIKGGQIIDRSKLDLPVNRK